MSIIEKAVNALGKDKESGRAKVSEAGADAGVLESDSANTVQRAGSSPVIGDRASADESPGMDDRNPADPRCPGLRPLRRRRRPLELRARQ
jgi:hypothetical protein